ncbi:MAG: TIGR01777 family protein [Deltaproteobacteria bacterium CG11_big_fil_rev_8_21_14_0_20_47_16]|nr:MAG: TIGR01777 family protein [Deltaproteobacteria bacterium CG11_big_fil_rev_8_21_14_0_20_47_16]
MKIAVSGATGFVGSHLQPFLVQRGHNVIPISRSFFSNPNSQLFEGCDAVVHLAGANIADHRWSESYKNTILTSRTFTTNAVAKAFAGCANPPKVLISASAIGFYGDRSDDILDESSTVGSGFLASVAHDWEAACDPVRDKGIRVVNPRFGMILSKEGGALAKILPMFRWGLGGVLGSGKQWISWIALQDVLSAIMFAIETPTLHGPVNVASPEPVRQTEFAHLLGQLLHRPVLPVPAWSLKLTVGDMAEDVLLASQRVIPSQLIAHKFPFQYPLLEPLLESIVAA